MLVTDSKELGQELNKGATQDLFLAKKKKKAAPKPAVKPNQKKKGKQMSGVSTVIQEQFLIGAGASATLYIYTGNLNETNLCIVSTVDLTFHMADGFGGNQSTALVGSPVPHSLNIAPNGVTFSTGGRSYVSMLKVSGTSVTTVSPILVRCGPWLKVVFGNQEASDGFITVLGEV